MADTYETRARDVEVARFGPLDWSAIFAGAIIALVVHFLLNLLGASIGAAAIDVTPGGTAPAPMGVAAFGWWSISGILAAFLGGAIAGRLALRSGHEDAVTHGLLAWAVPTLVVVAAVAGVIGGATASVSNIAGPLGADMNALRTLQEFAPTPADEMAFRAQAEAIADRAGATAFASFIALVIGAAAAMFGAYWATRRRHGWPAETSHRGASAMRR
jgi:hypothetical protein